MRTLATTERQCAACGSTFQGKGRAKFCSGRCRKAQYATPCADCGALTSGSDGRREDAICKLCASRRASAVIHNRWAPRRERIAELYRQGVPLDDIARDVGLPGRSHLSRILAEMRASGCDLPYRYTTWAGVPRASVPSSTKHSPPTNGGPNGS